MRETSNGKRRVLVVSEYSPLDQWLEKLRPLRQDLESSLYILYVLPNLPATYYHLPSMAAMEQWCIAHADQMLNQLCRLCGINREWGGVVRSHQEALQFAKEYHCHEILGDIQRSLMEKVSEPRRRWMDFFFGSRLLQAQKTVDHFASP